MLPFSVALRMVTEPERTGKRVSVGLDSLNISLNDTLIKKLNFSYNNTHTLH